MKKQILAFSVVIVSMVLFSCSKEKLEMPTNGQVNNEEAVLPYKPIVDPLTQNLEGRFEFNNSLVDLTGKLATPYSSAAEIKYGTDRKGNPSGAIVFQGNHYLAVSAVPRQPNSSVSLWIKYNTSNSAGILVGSSPRLDQVGGGITAQTFNNNSVAAECNFQTTPDNAWHHIVIAAESSSSKFYLDGKLVKTVNAAILGRPGFGDYVVGSGGMVGFWTGSMDDLRFYSRTLTATDVKALYGSTLTTSVQ